MSQKAPATLQEDDEYLGSPIELLIPIAPYSETDIYIGSAGHVFICEDDDDLIVIGFGKEQPVRVDFDAECAMVDEVANKILPLVEQRQECWLELTNAIRRGGIEKLRDQLSGDNMEAPDADVTKLVQINERIEEAIWSFLGSYDEHIHCIDLRLMCV